MTERELLDAIDGLLAYDVGALDSGISDEALRERVAMHLRLMRREERNALLARFVREHVVSDEAVKQGRGIADVAELVDWLRGPMGVSV